MLKHIRANRDVCKADMWAFANLWGKDGILKNYVESLSMWKKQLVYLPHTVTHTCQLDLGRKGKL